MSVLVDSPIWSLAFRRKTATSPEAIVLAQLVRRDEAMIIGAVRQEVLSGIRSGEQFTRIRDLLRPYPDALLNEHHYERAAKFHNTCRSHGVQGSHTDFLVCAVASLAKITIFTTDKDFPLFARHLPIKLYAAS